MTQTQLSRAIRAKSDQLSADGADIDTVELLLVLARIVEGQTISRAFGAPGEWGYGKPIGDGLLDDLKKGLLPPLYRIRPKAGEETEA